MTKADIINEIAEKTGVDKADVTASVEAFFSVVKNSMSNGNNIYIRGFGSFINKKRKKKIARNISRNTALVIDEHYVPAFKPAKIFVSKIKNSEKVKLLADKAENFKEEDVDKFDALLLLPVTDFYPNEHA